MALFSSIYKAFPRSFQKIPASMGGLFEGGFQGFTNLGERGLQLKAYQGHAYKCVTLIYRRAISVPMKLYKMRGERFEKVKRHPFLDLMREPNSFMSGSDLKAITFMHRDLTGMAFWLLAFNSLGRPTEIWPLPVHKFIRFRFNEAKTELVKYEFKTDSKKIIQYDPEEIVYFRYPHPLHPLEGASPIQAQAYAYDTDLAMKVYQRKFFQKSMRPDVVFETDQKIDPADAKRLLLTWKEAHRGVDRSWEPAILDQGLKLQVLSGGQDFEFAALARWTKEDIFEAYNVPEGKLGGTKNVKDGSDLAIDITFNSECIMPRLRSYEEAISSSIMPYYDGGLFVKHANCVPRDREYDLKEREVNLKGLATTINEERAKEGLKPVPWGYAPWVPANTYQPGHARGNQRVEQ